MKFDFHCHTKNGSLDAKVDIAEYAGLLKEKGFGGMMVTDHNSYNGYRAWKKFEDRTGGLPDFTVLKGIEYDTLDAGHILVVMPDDVNLKILEVRGLPVRMLVRVVHKYGGILGPAHPYGAKFLSAMRAGIFSGNEALIRMFDFVEGFNTCELPEANEKSRLLAEAYGMVSFGGSDSHKMDYIGMAYTEIEEPVENCNDLIRLVKAHRIAGCGGTARMPKEQAPVTRLALGAAWKVYNRGLAAVKSHARTLGLRELGLVGVSNSL